MKKCVRIEIEYDDGSIDRAVGDDAAKILDWYNAGQTMNTVHGFHYHGPNFETIPPASKLPVETGVL